MAQTVVGLFENESEAQLAVQQLQQIGITNDQVDVSRGTARQAGLNDDGEKENGITRFFKSLFGDNDDSDRYSKLSNSGATVVTVHAQSSEQAEKAADLLDDAGAIDVDEKSSQWSSEGFTSGSTNTGLQEESATINRVQEELQVGKRTVENGAVRLRSRIVEKPVEESIRLREENVHVERQPVNRPVSDMDRNAFQDQDIELTERSEVPVVNKEARVVEEVKISKDVTERNETVRDTVRNTEVDIDESGKDHNNLRK